MDAANIRALFPGLRDTIYMNTATMGVGCAAAQEALSLAIDQWTRGCFDWTDAERRGEEARAMFAAMIGADADEVAIVPTASTAAGLVAANMPDAQPGENVVVAAHEFSSNYFPWLLLKERGYDVRTIAPPNGELSEDRFAEAADGGTRLIAVSAVQSSDGYRVDLPAISALAARSGARVFVDASQAAGAVPIDVVRDGVDFLVAVSYKFLSGPRGIGYLYVRRELLDRLRPVTPGWKAARKPMESFYGPGMDLSPTASKLDTSLVWFAAVAELATRRVFERVGLETIYERNARLAGRLHAALADRWPELQMFPAGHRSHIVSVPIADPSAAMTRLRDAGIVASLRAGRIRLSSHFYNLEEEIDKAVVVLGRELIAEGGVMLPQRGAALCPAKRAPEILMRLLLATVVTLLLAAPASAQLSPFNAAGITYGHVHMNVADVELAKKIFVEHFGGVAVSKGPLQAVKLPNMLVAFRQAEPTGPSQGTVVDHFGFHVKDIEAVKAKWKAAGYEVTQEFTGAEGFPNAYLAGPGGLRLELQEKKELPVVAAVNHVHFNTADFEKELAWYIDTFGLTKRARGTIQTTADAGAVNLSFQTARTPTVATRGRTIDHIGFEVKNLEAFCKQLEAKGIKFDTPYRDVPAIGLKIAYITDPSGVYIELTEGYDKY